MKKLLPLLLLFSISYSYSQDRFEPLDVYNLEFATNPQISPDGKEIVYARSFMDVMTDRRLSNLWTIDWDGNNHRPLTTGNQNDRNHRWSPDGSKLAYVSNKSGTNQIHLLWMDNGRSSKITNLQTGMRDLVWSPDGKHLAFVMSIKKETKPFGNMPKKPKGAKWADPPKYFDKLVYRSDGSGYPEESYAHIFILPIEGGTPRQISTGDFNHRNPQWSNDGKAIFCSANRANDWEYSRRNTEIFSINISDKSIKQLTDRNGPDGNPRVSPDGKQIAYIGHDDKKMGYHNDHLYVMNIDGSNKKILSDKLDLSFNNIQWKSDGSGLYFQYDEKGNTKIGFINQSGKMKNIANNLGGSSIGRPYDGGDYDVSKESIVFMQSTPTQPAELAVKKANGSAKKITSINDDVLTYTELGKVEEIWYKSSHDGIDIQGWIMTPPGFDANKKYPLILEIHGGPFANYGDRFSPELQLFASQGYVVLYTNPRGSTSYGADFANLIHHNYPSNDYDDLMSGVDALIKKGYIDSDRLFITGGSGGGVLTSWTIGKTNRFAAAVVAKPVINWYSWALTADISEVAYYWFPGPPWEHQDQYMKRSPISLVGNVQTPTMLLTGEEDYRTPMSESEQYYQALKMRKVPSALVRIQGASHGIASKPSNLLAKVSYISAWFEQYDKK